MRRRRSNYIGKCGQRNCGQVSSVGEYPAGVGRVPADATSSPFFEVALCTLRLSVIGGFVGAAETEALGGSKITKS